jgi:hypothetical protein
VVQTIINNGDNAMNLSDTDKFYISHVLDGNIEALNKPFYWSDSPQGFDFWHDQYEAGQLTPEGRAALEAMLND